MEPDKAKKKRALLDRRSGQDRRQSYNIDYFMDGGVERRNTAGAGRRHKKKDRRKNWIKISRWCSLCFKKDTSKPAENESTPPGK